MFTAWRNWSNSSQWSMCRSQTASYSECQRDPGAHVALRRSGTKILCTRLPLNQTPCTGTLSYSYPGAEQEPAQCAGLQFLSPSEQTLHFTKDEQFWLVTFKDCFLFVADMKKRGSRPEKKGKINAVGRGKGSGFIL